MLDSTDVWLEALQAYARQARRDHRLALLPYDSVELENADDGSRVTLDARIEHGRVQTLGYKVRACSIGQAATMILVRHAPGMDLPALQAMRSQLMAVIAGAKAPDVWPELAIFGLVRDVPSRHRSALLPFDALEQLFLRAAEGGAPTGITAGNFEAPE